MNLALWLASCQKCSEFTLPGAIENCLGHNGASRISGAKEEHVVWLSICVLSHSLPPRFVFLVGLQPRTASHMAWDQIDDHSHTAELVACEVSGAQHDLLSLIVLAMRASRSPLPSP